jgi:hypothetical protein
VQSNAQLMAYPPTQEGSFSTALRWCCLHGRAQLLQQCGSIRIQFARSRPVRHSECREVAQWQRVAVRSKEAPLRESPVAEAVQHADERQACCAINQDALMDSREEQLQLASPFHARMDELMACDPATLAAVKDGYTWNS